MRLLLASILVLALFSQGLALHLSAAPLKALLSCNLPAVYPEHPLAQYSTLAEMINKLLQQKGINVKVEVCDPATTGLDLHNEDKINSLFDRYDILEVDSAYLWAITSNLVTFKKSQIDYYKEAYGFAWVPTTVQGDDVLLKGSPGLLHTNFIEKRGGYNYEKKLYAELDPDSAFGLVDLYLNFFINNGGDLRDIEYSQVDYSSAHRRTIAQMKKLLNSCQGYNKNFEYGNMCLTKQQSSFLDTNFQRTIGFSENLFNFQNRGIDNLNFDIENIAGGRKIFYVDSFVAKEGSDKATVLSFYKFMLSEDVLDIYTKGLYTSDPKWTYILPPKQHYMMALAGEDRIYRNIYQLAYQGPRHQPRQYPIYQPEFVQNAHTFAKKIADELQLFV